MKTTTNFRTLRLVQLALFTAIIALMDITQIGYIVKPGLSITLLVIPVTVGAIVLGPTSGAILGAVFGLTSFAKCFGADALGTALIGINPIGTFLMTMVPRILMGWLTGLIFKGLKKIDKTKGISYAISCLLGPMMNSVFFLSALVLIFYKTKEIQDIAAAFGAKNAFALVLALAGVNAIIEIAVCFIIGTAISKALDYFAEKNTYKNKTK